MKSKQQEDAEELKLTKKMLEWRKRKRTQRRRVEIGICILGIGALVGSIWLSEWIVEVIFGLPIISGEQTEGFKGIPTRTGTNWSYYIWIFLSIIFIGFSWWILGKIQSKIFDKLNLNLYEPPIDF